MTRKRRNLIVLVMVAALVAASVAVILSKPTRLGLDLSGGVELVYQGEANDGGEPSGADIDTALEIIRQRIDQFGVAEPEVARIGPTQISIGLPDVTNLERAKDQVGTTAQLYFYDWEPNLIGIEKRVGGTPGTNPAKPTAQLSKMWDDAGRASNVPENRDLINSGALPSAYAAAQLAAKQPADPNCAADGCSEGVPRYYLFDKGPDHALIAGPEKSKAALFVTPQGVKQQTDAGVVRTEQNSDVIEVPPGTIVVSELPSDRQTGEVIENADPGWYALNDRPALTGSDITDPQQNTDPTTNAPNVTFNFTNAGQKAFQEVTRAIAIRGQNRAPIGGGIDANTAGALSGHFAVVLDNQVKTRPIINFQENPDGIDGRTGAQISGGFNSIGEAQDLAKTLQIGALPIDLRLISSTKVSATLGDQALQEGLLAGIVGLIAVILFLVAFYRLLGLIATVALIAYGVIFFAMIKLIPITLTLPGIAGLILTIGVAADSNIVIFERIKEEVRKGRSMSSSIAAGYRQGIGTIIDANVVTLLTAFILFVLATAGVKGFAFTLGVGTITSLLTAVIFTQALLGSMSRSRLLRSPSALGAASGGRQWTFDFMGASRWFFSVSGVILIIGGLALATKQLNFGIDFESGTRVTASLVQSTDENGVRDALSAAGITGEEIQEVSNQGFEKLGKNTFQIQSGELGPAGVDKVQKTLNDNFGVVNAGFDSTSVGPTFGREIARSAIRALILSLLVITGYIAFRFQPKFAIPVLIAIFHDILITGGVYALTGREVSSGTVAAFLTILGYSLYDTIIVFDRIRENLPRMPRAAFSQIVNRSMSEVLTRSLATSLSTLLGVASLLIFGGDTLKDFAFAMFVGIASGTYSSIFIASPVLTAWKEREPVYKARHNAIAAANNGVVPAYAEEIEVAKLDSAGDAKRDADATKAAGKQHAVDALAGAISEDVIGSEGEQVDDEPDSNGAGEADVPLSATGPGALSSEERKARRDKRRRQREQRRRKHGRPR